MLQGDCLKILPTLGRFQVVVTSPPYNIGAKYSLHRDRTPRNEYLTWMERVFAAIERSMTKNGSFFLNVGWTNSDPWIGQDVASIARRYFVLQNTIAWVKSVAVNDVTYGQFKPMRGPRYLSNSFEIIYHFTKTGEVPIDRLALGVPYNAKENIQKWGKGKDLRCRGNVWHIPYESRLCEPQTGLNQEVGDVDGWITVSEAARLAKVNKAVVSIAVQTGKLLSNGEVRFKRRIHGPDFRRWLTERSRPKKHDHPAAFPWKLAAWCIKLHGVTPKLKVLDPFLGVGNTLLAAKHLGVHGTGIEIDPAYAEQARRRLK